MTRSKDSSVRRLPRVLALLLASSIALFAAHQMAGRADATGIPTTEPLFYGGTVFEDGRPVDGVREVTVNVWGPDGEEGVAGELLCTTDRQQADVQGGHFRIEMPTDCVEAIRSESDIRTEVIFDGESLGRVKTGAVPYAAQAEQARLADVATRARESRGDFAVPGAATVTGDVAAATATLGSTDAQWLQIGAGALDVTDDGVVAPQVEVSPNGLSPNGSNIFSLTPGVSGAVTMRADGSVSTITIQSEVSAVGLVVEGDAQFDVGPTITGMTTGQRCQLPVFETDYVCPNSVVKGFVAVPSAAAVYCSVAVGARCLPPF